MEDLPFGRIAALVPEFAVKDLPLRRTLILMMMIVTDDYLCYLISLSKFNLPLIGTFT